MASTEVVLLPEADGSVGKVAVRAPEGEVLLERAFEGTSARSGEGPLAPAIVDGPDLAARFAALLRFQAESGFDDISDLRDRIDIPDSDTPAERDGSRDGGDASGSGLDAGDGVSPAGPDADGGGTAAESEQAESGEEEDDDEAEEAAEADSGRQEGGDDEAAEGDDFDDRLADLLDGLELGRDELRARSRERFRLFDDEDEEDDDDDDGPDEDGPLPGGNDGIQVNGTAGNDVQQGASGDDTLVGSAGADLLRGGGGFDLVDYSNSPAGVQIDLGLGTAAGGDAAGDTLESIENLVGSAFVDQLTGDGGQNIISGRGGDDVLDGGGADNDIVDFRRDPAGVTVDLAAGTAADGFGGNDVIQNFENVFGSEFADSVDGDGGNNTVDARGGADTVNGGNGNDTLAGGGGDDSLSGNSGDDRLTGADGADTLVGAQGRDFLDGGDDDDDLFGGANDDRLQGGEGADDLDGGAGRDTALYGDAEAGVAVAFANTDGGGIGGSFANTAAGGLAGEALGDTFTDLEAFEGSDFDDTVGGGAVDMSFTLGEGDDIFDTAAGINVRDRVEGGDGDDTIRGGDGVDDLRGGEGNDSLLGENGGDRLLGGPGADDLTGGGGRDTFVFGRLTDGTEISTNQTIAAAGVETDTINDFTTGFDSFEFDVAQFQNVGLRVVIGSYDGTNSGLGLGRGATFVVDSTHLIYDPDVDQPGFVAIADVDGTVPVLADLNII